jgi:uncharacterized RDD family membrane protein YckC
MEVRVPTTWRQRLAGQLVAFTTLTVPVALYFALFDASRLRATPGKRLLGLQTVTETGGRVPTIRAILRAMVKLAPWELAHTALWTTPGWPAQAAPRPLNLAGFGLSLALASGYVLTLFVGSRRTPYDHVAGTRVVRSSSR